MILKKNSYFNGNFKKLNNLIKNFNINLPVHVPPLFHAVDLQAQVSAGSLYDESAPMHAVQIVALLHALQLLLQAEF